MSKRTFEVTEYQPSIAALQEIRDLKVEHLIDRTNAMLKVALRLDVPPISIERNAIIVRNVVGIIPLGHKLSIEVRPKFMSGNHWRDDFALMVSLSRYGTVLPGVSSNIGVSAHANLRAHLAVAYSEMTRGVIRMPLRTYRSNFQRSFSLHGSWDAMDILIPDAEGFSQESAVLTVDNPIMAILCAAAREIESDAPDDGTRSHLRVLGRLTSIAPPRFTGVRLPGHGRKIELALSVAKDILLGGGATLQGREATGLGFALRGDKVWEDVVAAILNGAFPGQTERHRKFRFGRTSRGRPVNVWPDHLINRAVGGPIVIDSKYKTIKSKTGKSKAIVSADLYESAAYAHAARSDLVILVYPSDYNGDTAGSLNEISRITIDRTKIDVVSSGLSVEGISQRNGLRSASLKMRETLSEIVT